MSDERKVVQIATSTVATGSEETTETHENLYALDSEGEIYQWTNATPTRTAGWIRMDVPWNGLSVVKNEPPVSGKISDWLARKYGSEINSDILEEIQKKLRNEEWRK